MVPEAQRQELQIFASLTITNPATLALISHAFEDVEEELAEQAVVFKMDTEQGKALLSSPNGADALVLSSTSKLTAMATGRPGAESQ